MKLKRIVSIGVVGAVVACATLVMPTFSLAAASGGYVDYAKVVESEPLLRTVRVSIPRQECWDETVTVTQPAPGKSYTPEIFGSILGAAVGNQFGRGSGRDIATVAGAVLGGSLAHDYKNRRAVPYGQTYQTVEERCQTIHEQHTEERIDGYDVTYRYNGREYSTRMAHDPGDTIRVRVSVSPLE